MSWSKYSEKRLTDADIKPGMEIKCPAFGSQTVWTVLDKAPLPEQWWLHRWTEEGEWKCIAVNRHEIEIVSEGSRIPEQLTLV